MIAAALNEVAEAAAATLRDTLQALHALPAAGIEPPVRMPHDKRPWLKSCFQPGCPRQAPPVVAANAKVASAAPRKLALACAPSVAFPASCDAAAKAKQPSITTEKRRTMALPMLELARRGLLMQLGVARTT
eukprot:CAMPEP_0204145566 /NCGR_PEP_ID=MMETSP0361-20130328/21658_1 /ASSEMBLY_ACC=CAM_ASM_000343 /TAXON_ID=268821 /ORGANISM="Scrippsiella Hangoei, Strain SHTV-5" /LENGTH=131 /DNA_ID=CAMNT_0051099587 /DNA_START=380 /DNA_END=776 /DNA_ORIENTATION=+